MRRLEEELLLDDDFCDDFPVLFPDRDCAILNVPLKCLLMILLSNTGIYVRRGEPHHLRYGSSSKKSMVYYFIMNGSCCKICSPIFDCFSRKRSHIIYGKLWTFLTKQSSSRLSGAFQSPHRDSPEHLPARPERRSVPPVQPAHHSKPFPYP